MKKKKIEFHAFKRSLLVCKQFANSAVFSTLGGSGDEANVGTAFWYHQFVSAITELIRACLESVLDRLKRD